MLSNWNRGPSRPESITGVGPAPASVSGKEREVGVRERGCGPVEPGGYREEPFVDAEVEGSMKPLIMAIVQSLVDRPEEVQIKEVVGEHAHVLELRVAKEDLGKVIGKGGAHASAIRTIMAATSDRSAGEVYNVAPSHEITLRQFAAGMVRALGSKKFEVSIPYAVAYAWCAAMEGWSRLRRVKEMPYLTRAGLRFLNKGLYLDGSKARDELGWEPKVSIEEGTRRYVEWRRSDGAR